jgi:hypothetical protein
MGTPLTPHDELRDHERLAETSDALLYAAMTCLVVRRSTHNREFSHGCKRQENSLTPARRTSMRLGSFPERPSPGKVADPATHGGSRDVEAVLFLEGLAVLSSIGSGFSRS